MNLEPKQKAEELVEKYEDVLGHSDLNVCPTDDLEVETRATAIQCAIIAVDEIVMVVYYREDKQYWADVKSELLKML